MTAKPRDLVAALRARGLVHQVTDEALGPLSAKERITAYIGFDPSASSLHAGSLYPVMLLAQIARAGHRPIAVLGGFTGAIGDPSGKDAERELLPQDTLDSNLESQRTQISRLLRGAGVDPVVLDNREWLEKLPLLSFLRLIGKHFTVNSMIAKDAIRSRLEDREQGISYTEFSYPLLQSIDFLTLFEAEGCRLQMGASDQWGNITAGIELIRKRLGKQAFGITCPLLLTPEGKKFGKSAGNAVWLDGALTSPYRFFQFWMNQEDAAAADLLAPYTFLPMEEVAALRAEAAKAPEKRLCQRRLAREVTSFVHGKDATDRAERAARVLFGEGSLRDLDEATLREVFGSVPALRRPKSAASTDAYAALFCDPALGLCASKGEFKRLLAQKALSVNDAPLAAETVRAEDLLPGGVLILRKGKKSYGMVEYR